MTFEIAQTYRRLLGGWKVKYTAEGIKWYNKHYEMRWPDTLEPEHFLKPYVVK
jgi:hypothetical protein